MERMFSVLYVACMEKIDSFVDVRKKYASIETQDNCQDGEFVKTRWRTFPHIEGKMWTRDPHLSYKIGVEYLIVQLIDSDAISVRENGN